MVVCTSYSSQSISVLRRSSRAAGATPGVKDVVDPSTPGDDGSIYSLVVTDDDDVATS